MWVSHARETRGTPGDTEHKNLVPVPTLRAVLIV